MNDAIDKNNQLRESQILSESHKDMTKLEYISMNLLQGLLSNPEWSAYNKIDSGELVNRAVELSKMLIKKINE